jgi:pimeloyl-ACP methyl ester carboxylesterase
MRFIIILLLIGFSVNIQGCMFKDLKQELETFEGTYVIAGKVMSDIRPTGSVIAALVRHDNAQRSLHQIVFIEPTGDFSFLVPAGVYSLAAFEDVNNNMICDTGEAAGFYGGPDKIVVPSGSIDAASNRDATGLTIRITSQALILHRFPELTQTPIAVAQSLMRLGSIAQLDDPIFSPENGALGYWKPATFMQNLGFGIYFSEPYHPRKVPVIFVHGALGTPADFASIVEALDRKNFQPWYFYYPSGVRLGNVVDALVETVERIRDKYEFESMIVTAHSMGGLVSRGFINKFTHAGTDAVIPLFVSISTPWGGSKMAAKGAAQAPVAVPSWHDMDPQSEFIQNLFAMPLPAFVDHRLFFRIQG